MSPMIYTIHIPDKDTRIQFAVEVKNLVSTCTTYIPGATKGVYTCDIGVQATINQKKLMQIEALINRRGYRYSIRKSRANSASTF